LSDISDQPVINAHWVSIYPYSPAFPLKFLPLWAYVQRPGHTLQKILHITPGMKTDDIRAGKAGEWNMKKEADPCPWVGAPVAGPRNRIMAYMIGKIVKQRPERPIAKSTIVFLDGNTRPSDPQIILKSGFARGDPGDLAFDTGNLFDRMISLIFDRCEGTSAGIRRCLLVFSSHSVRCEEAPDTRRHAPFRAFANF
jgi:hypothetical protein